MPAPSTRIRPRIAWLAALGLLFALIGAGTAWLAREQTLHDVTTFLSRSTDGRMRFEGVSGSLLREIRIEHVDWQTERVHYRFDGVSGRFSPLWLLLATVSFHDVRMARAQIVQLDVPEARDRPDASWRTRLRIRFVRAGADTLLWQHEQDLREFRDVGLDVDVGWHAWTLALDRSTSAWGRLTGRLRLATAAPHALDASLALRRDDPSPLKVDVTAKGDLSRYTVSGDMHAGASSAQASADLVTSATPQVQKADAQVHALNPRDILPTLPVALIDGTLHAVNEDNSLRGELSLRNDQAGPVDSGRVPVTRVHSDIGSDGGAWLFNALEVELGEAGTLHGSARVSDVAFAAQLDGDGIDPRGLVSSLQPGKAKLKLATRGDYRAQRVEASVRDRNFQVEIAGVASREALEVERARALVANGSFDASGRVAFAEGHAFSMKASAKQFDVAQIGRFRPSRLTGSLSATGTTTPVLHTEGNATLAPSTLFGLPASGRASWRSRGTDNPRISIDGKASVGHTTIAMTGTVDDPQDLKSLDFKLALDGRDLGELFTIGRLPFPTTEPYRVDGRLRYRDNTWSFSDFHGSVGRSDIAGSLVVDVRPARNYLRGDLTSQRLDMRDLSGLVGAHDAKRAPGRLLPRGDFQLAKLRTTDADITFTGRSIRNETLPLHRMSATFALHDGVLLVKPLTFRAAGGAIDGNIRVDARQPILQANVDLKAEHLALGRLAPGVKAVMESAGTIEARARLAMQGNSPAALLAAANGDVIAVMNGGQVSDLMLRMADLDLANSLLVLIRGDKPIAVNCMIADFVAQKGQLEPRTLLLDTEHTVIAGDGSINLASEQMDITLKALPKDASVFALRGPIKVDGTLARPAIHPQLGGTVARVGAAVALGALAPPAALIPFLQTGQEAKVNCASKVDEASRSLRAALP